MYKDIIYKVLSHIHVRERRTTEERFHFIQQPLKSSCYFLIQKGRKIQVDKPVHATNSAGDRERDNDNYLWNSGVLTGLREHI